MTFFALFMLFILTLYLLEAIAVRTAVVTLNEARNQSSLAPVSILKPLKGLEDGLFDNIESFCNLDYPEYEIILTLQDKNDPAYKVARKIQDKYPSIDISIVVERCGSGLNPKVNNLIPAYKTARHGLILISDSNVRVKKDYLSSIASHMNDPSVGLVSNLIRGVSGGSIGAVMENLHLNSFVTGSVCFLDKYLDMPCVVGKSMLMRKSDLAAIGGLYSVKDFLAEDYIIGQRIHSLGKKVVLSNHIIDNVNEYWGLNRFINRHTRWGKLRWQIGGVKYLSELFTNAVFMALLSMIFMSFSTASIAFAAAVSALKIAHDAYIGKWISSGMNPLLYLLAPLKDIVIGLIWFVPIFSTTVNWRGNRYVIGRGSALSPLPRTGLSLSRYRVFGLRKANRPVLPTVELAEE